MHKVFVRQCKKFYGGVMRRIHLSLSDPVLHTLVSEQMAIIGTLVPADQCDVMITDHTSPAPAPSYIFLLPNKPAHITSPAQCLPLPLKIGKLIDMVLYITLARARRDHQRSGDIILKNARLNAQTGLVVCNDHTTRLTDREVDLVMALYHAPDHSLDRATLLSDVWGYAENVETHTLETHIYRLRQKLETEIGLLDLIVTDQGTYKLMVE